MRAQHNVGKRVQKCLARREAHAASGLTENVDDDSKKREFRFGIENIFFFEDSNEEGNDERWNDFCSLERFDWERAGAKYEILY